MMSIVHDFITAALPWMTLAVGTAVVVSVSRYAKEKGQDIEK
jgi:hypothetical protein